MSRKIHIVGNWKMNQTLEDIKSFFVEIQKSKMEFPCEKWIAPQAVHIPIVKDLAYTIGNVLVGAQNSCYENSGAFTGETSPATLNDLGVHFTLVGHSERRAIYKEDNETLNLKTLRALENNLKVIFCVGESLEENETGRTEEVVIEQLQNGLKDVPEDKIKDVLIAYEPVWAIGTGKTATPEQAEEAHSFIRHYAAENLGFLSEELIILYGGSVKPDNVDGLLSQPNIDGALVGGASLKGPDFRALCEASIRHSNKSH